MKGKTSLTKTIIVFAVILLLITFFSRTVYQYNLPVVTLGFAEGGVIRNSAKVSGGVEVSDFTDIIAYEEGKITLHVAEGEIVEAGQLLYTIEADMDSLKERLKTLEYNRDSVTVQINRLNADINYYQRKDLNSAEIVNLDLSTYDLEIQQLESQIKQANDELARLKTLYEMDAIAKTDLENQENALKDLQSQLNAAIQTRQSAIDRHNSEKNNESKSYEQALQANNKTLTDLNYNLQTNRLELQFINEEIEDIKGKLEGDGIYEYHSKISGEIVNIYEAAKGGRYVSKNTLLLSIQPEDTKYYAVFTVDNNTPYVEIGQQCSLYIKSKNARNIEGVVENIKYGSEDFAVYVSFDYPNIRGGERVETVFEKNSGRYDKVLPNSAIREDQSGSYVLLVERQKTSFGYDYVAKQQYVYIQEEGPSHSAVNDNFTDEAVIIGSSKIIGDGSKVRIIE